MEAKSICEPAVDEVINLTHTQTGTNWCVTLSGWMRGWIPLKGWRFLEMDLYCPCVFICGNYSVLWPQCRTAVFICSGSILQWYFHVQLFIVLPKSKVFFKDSEVLSFQYFHLRSGQVDVKVLSECSVYLELFYAALYKQQWKTDDNFDWIVWL